MADSSSSKKGSQQFVPVRDIRDGVVILKNGQMCMVLLATSINFALKSQDEQQAILQQFQVFLNTLDFSLQMYMQSRRLDIDPYLNKLAQLESQQDNDLMRIQLREYIDFIRNFTEEVDVMSKNFFVIIPYTPGAIDVKSGLSGVFSSAAGKAPPEEKRFEEQRTQLEQRVSIVENGLNRLGVKTVPLGNDDLVELYYHIFNPRDIKHRAPKTSS